MKILVIRFSSIGDIVLTTPVLRCLKKQVGGAVIHYLTKESFAGILSANPYIDRFHFLGADMKALIQELRQETFDLVIDLHHNLRTLRIRKALGVRAYAFDKLNLEKWLLTNLKWDRLPDEHIVDRYLRTTAQLGVVNDGAGLDHFIPADEQVDPASLPEGFRNGYVAIAVGAAHATKRIPPEKISLICAGLPLPVVLLGGKQDQEIGASIAAPDPTRIFNACGRYTLHQSASLINQSGLLITPDTGLMHIGAALKKPILAVWGNTVKAFGMYPYYGGLAVPHRDFEVSGLPCRPCSKIGYEHCPKGHFNCMNRQDTDAIIAAACKLLQGLP